MPSAFSEVEYAGKCPPVWTALRPHTRVCACTCRCTYGYEYIHVYTCVCIYPLWCRVYVGAVSFRTAWIEGGKIPGGPWRSPTLRVVSGGRADHVSSHQRAHQVVAPESRLHLPCKTSGDPTQKERERVKGRQQRLKKRQPSLPSSLLVVSFFFFSPRPILCALRVLRRSSPDEDSSLGSSCVRVVGVDYWCLRGGELQRGGADR